MLTMNGASGGDNNNNSRNKDDSTIDRKTAEKSLGLKFAEVLVREYPLFLKNWCSWDTRKKLAKNEKEVLFIREVLYDGIPIALIKGGAFGIASLVLLRFRRNISLKGIIKSCTSVPSGNGGGGRTPRSYNSPFAQQGSNAFPTQGSTSHGMSESELSRIDRLVKRKQPGSGWLVDTTLSLFIAAVVSLESFASGSYEKLFVELPLIDEKSVVCDLLCPPMIQELDHVRRELSDIRRTKAEKEMLADCLKNPQDPLLKVLLRMAENCNNRALRENPDSFVSKKYLNNDSRAEQIVTDVSDDGNSNNDDDDKKK